MTPGQPACMSTGSADDLSATSVDGYRDGMGAGSNGVGGRGYDLYAQAEAAREQSLLLAGQLQTIQRKTSENWQLIQASWDRTQQIRALWLAAGSDKDLLRYSPYARSQAKLASLPVIEQAKGVIMAQCGWPEDQAFDALRKASQRENIKVRDLAAMIVAKTASSEPAQRLTGQAPATARSRGGLLPDDSGGICRHQASA
jgi:hypothetical protein